MRRRDPKALKARWFFSSSWVGWIVWGWGVRAVPEMELGRRQVSMSVKHCIILMCRQPNHLQEVKAEEDGIFPSGMASPDTVPKNLHQVRMSHPAAACYFPILYRGYWRNPHIV